MQLFIALYCEGKTDDRFYTEFLERYIMELGYTQGKSVDVASYTLDKRYDMGFLEAMQDIENECSGVSYIFIHNDADGRNTDDVLKHKWYKWIELAKCPEFWMPIIPIKNLESWLLADREALMEVFLIDDKNLSKILTHKPESVPDPKETIKKIQNEGKYKQRNHNYQGVLAKRIRFSEIEKLESFQRFRDCLMKSIIAKL